MCDHENREAAMVTTHRKDDGTPSGWCDPCLEPLIRALNDGGLPTVASCCGHEHRPGRVTLADGREIVVLTPEWADAFSEFVHDRVGCKSGHECTTCASAGGAR